MENVLKLGVGVQFVTVALMLLSCACIGGVSAPRAHRACTASAPRHVFEQLPSQMVYWERSCKWYLVGS